jgi:AcrR family transcriptional regulator
LSDPRTWAIDQDMSNATTNRRPATQARSKLTVEKILASATALIVSRATDDFTMTEVAQGADVVIGAVYRYFSDKSQIIAMLLERQNSKVGDSLRAALSEAKTFDALLECVENLSVQYFDLHQSDPLFLGLWSAVQADRILQARDLEDTLANAKDYFDAAKPLYRKVDDDELLTTCTLIIHLLTGTARMATALPADTRQNSIETFNAMARHALIRLELG